MDSLILRMLYRSFLLYFLSFGGLWSSVAQPIAAHPDNRFLTTKAGEPFFWLADTGWELFHRLDRQEAERYILKRKAQGFNILQAVVLHELQAFETPNAYGDFPLMGMTIDSMNLTQGEDFGDQEAYDYWDHVRYIVAKAAEHDMIIGLLPCWGEYVTPRKRPFRVIGTLDHGYRYGQWLGQWLSDYNDHIVWILGGDRLPDERPDGVEIWRSMAEGITDGVVGEDRFDQQAEYEKTFMTYHCYATSANWFGEDDWIDMHTWGSYHEKRNNDRAIYAAWAEWDRVNHKPHVNSEPAYENLPINYDWANVSQGVFDDFDARQVAYWSVFGGAAGHTYGGHEVWIMHKFSNPNPALTQRLEIEWEEGLDLKGAGEMQHLKNLMLSQDPLSRRPNLTVIADNPHDPTGRLLACSGDGYIMVYAPTGKTIQL
ncbi:MAG: DUF4038 domain-containing protein, partial [Bacteroidota bacterium]